MFYFTQYQMKRLNNALSFTLLSSLTSKRNMKKFSFLPKSSPVQACRPLQAKFYNSFKHFQNQRRTNSATMHVKNSGLGMSNFQELPKKRNPRSTQHKFSFPCSENVKLSHQRQHFISLKRMKTTENVANIICFTN